MLETMALILRAMKDLRIPLKPKSHLWKHIVIASARGNHDKEAIVATKLRKQMWQARRKQSWLSISTLYNPGPAEKEIRVFSRWLNESDNKFIAATARSAHQMRFEQRIIFYMKNKLKEIRERFG